MNTNNNEDVTLNDEVEEGVEVIEGESAEDKAERLGNLNKQLFERAKKAEGFEKGADGKWVKPVKPAEATKPADTTQKEPSKDSLSQADLITVMRSNVPEEDLGDVIEFAAFKKISIAEALQNPVVKTLLAEKKESRDVAEGTNTGGARRGSGKLTDEALLADAQKGILPESDEDMRRLSTLQRKNRK